MNTREQAEEKREREYRTLLVAVEARMRRNGMKEDGGIAEEAAKILILGERTTGAVVPDSSTIDDAVIAAGAVRVKEPNVSRAVSTWFSQDGPFVLYPGDETMEKMKIQDGPRWVTLKAYSESRPFGPYVFWDYSFTEQFMVEHPELFVYTLIETKRGREIVNGYSPVDRIGHFFTTEDLWLGPEDSIRIE